MKGLYGLWYHTTGLCYTPSVVAFRAKLPGHESIAPWWTSAWSVHALFSTGEPVWAQYNVYLSLLPAAVGVGVCRHCNPSHKTLVLRKSQVTEWVIFLPLHLQLKCLQLLLVMQEDHLSTISETQKFENKCGTVGFSTLNWGLVLVCNF